MRKEQDEEFRKSMLNDRKVNNAMLMQYYTLSCVEAQWIWHTIHKLDP